MNDPTELETLRARVRQLHTDWNAWLDAPGARPVAALMIEALTLCMELVTALILARNEVEQLRAELAERPPVERRLDD